MLAAASGAGRLPGGEPGAARAAGWSRRDADPLPHAQPGRPSSPPPTSLNSEPAVLAALSRAAVVQGRRHGVVLMVELGTSGRASCPPTSAVAREAQALPGLVLRGIGTNLPARAASCRTRQHGRALALAIAVEPRAVASEVVSGGNSANLDWVTGCTTWVGSTTSGSASRSCWAASPCTATRPGSPHRRVHVGRRGHRGEGEAVRGVGPAPQAAFGRSPSRRVGADDPRRSSPSVARTSTRRAWSRRRGWSCSARAATTWCSTPVARRAPSATS